jgi:outer membrane protein TolC
VRLLSHRDGESRVQKAAGGGIGTEERERRDGTGTSPRQLEPPVIPSIALPFDVSWEPDLWGRVRNTVREYQYAAQVSAADLENERLTEQADLAEYYFELRGQDALQDSV